MSTINRVQLTGNLGKDPEVKTLGNGNKLAKFSMATREEFVNKDGEKASNTHWHYITAWGKVADRIETEFRKGSYVSIEGKLITRNYTDKEGHKRYITEVVASEAVLYQKAS